MSSPLLANIYLNEFDQWATRKWDLDHYTRARRRQSKEGNYKMVRYADDFVVVSNGTIAEVEATKQEIKAFLETELHLTLSDEKTLITHVNDGFDFLGFHIQRRTSGGKWVTHLRPSDKAKDKVKAKIKDLTSRNWTWMDEYTRLTTLNALVKGWAEYYRFTSLLSDIEEITKYTWHRYLGWLLDKHKDSRTHELICSKTRVIHNRTRWTAEIREEGTTLSTYQWLPTKAELNRKRYPQKGKEGFPHPYIITEAEAVTDFPEGAKGPAESLYSATIGATSRNSRKEPLEMSELKLRAKMRDGFKCARCGGAEELRVHHIKGTKSHQLENLETLCLSCHHKEHGYRQQKQA